VVTNYDGRVYLTVCMCVYIYIYIYICMFVCMRIFMVTDYDASVHK
jgi:hypothetical protein